MNFSAIPTILLFVITLAANLTASVIQTRYSRRTGGGLCALYLYTAASAAVSALTVFLLAKYRLEFSAFTVWLALLFGAVVCLQQLTLLLALSKGPLSYTMVIISMSTLITALSGVLFWHESLRAVQLVGIVLMVLCLVLSVKREPTKKGESSGGRRLSTMWLLLALLAMAFNGGVGILQKTHQSSAHKAELPAFLFVAFAFCAVFSALCCLFFAVRARGKGQEQAGESPAKSPRYLLRTAVTFLLSGVCVALCHCINLYLSGVVAAAVFFPIVNGGALMLTTLASLLLFHERLFLTQWLGLALGAVATFLLCM